MKKNNIFAFLKQLLGRRVYQQHTYFFPSPAFI